MALDTYVEGASSEHLESSLRYLVPKTSSVIIHSRQATVFAAGGAEYSSSQGVRAITFRIQGSGGATGGEFLDPSSLFFKAVCTKTESGNMAWKGPFWCCIQRVTVRLASTVVEDYTQFNRLYSTLRALSPTDEKTNALVAAGDKGSAVLTDAAPSGIFGFSMTPLALCRCGVLLPLSLVGALEIVALNGPWVRTRQPRW